MSALLQLGYCFMLIIGAAGAGSFLWRGKNESPAEHCLHASAVGFAAIHLFILCAGFARCLFPWLPSVLLAALFLAGCRPAFSIAQGVWREWRELPR
ncbi:MAG TPA: hypothetical protein PLB62_03180, partial [Candidatus Sumerlaeota bacterium]|nr:hypothetical protein [Candidatus Sumerlaeota bacterium]